LFRVSCSLGDARFLSVTVIKGMRLCKYHAVGRPWFNYYCHDLTKYHGTYPVVLCCVQLFAALKENTTLTSLDLSENLLTDESLQTLIGVLEAGSAPNLIYVDVRANPLSNKSPDALGRLQNLRKHLKVAACYIHSSIVCGGLEASLSGLCRFSAVVNYLLRSMRPCLLPQVDYSQEKVVGEGSRNDDDSLEGYPRNKLTSNTDESGGSLGWDDNPMTNIQIRFPTPEALQEKVVGEPSVEEQYIFTLPL
jgi:hypothetical protein